ncbi:hypothetical protein [Haloarcula montana]|uniref:hypothetical protein n=1 Tax=Haloarcula montana TaxID=3111776 RepID=UPI002D79BA66|nr:hypothetical protein [Haloarcula sp. GH36]
MYVTNTNTATQRLFNSGFMDEPVEFADTGTAQVPQEVGEALVDHYDTIKLKETDT